MMNLGGPATIEDVGPFLDRLFSDRDIIQLPIQFISGPTISRFRTPKVCMCFAMMGG
jgi:protoporphyrin/coproporphyrin ferrochelatase